MTGDGDCAHLGRTVVSNTSNNVYCDGYMQFTTGNSKTAIHRIGGTQIVHTCIYMLVHSVGSI